MKLIKPSYKITPFDADAMLQRIEMAGRTCYKSEDKITDASAEIFARNIIKRDHQSVIEHESIQVRFILDRGVSHELVRHRLAAYSQESTRYCNYGGGVTFIIPPWVNVAEGEYDQYSSLEPYPNLTDIDDLWFQAMLNAEHAYLRLLENGWSPQQARSVLPNSLKTEIVMTANLREWRHVFKLRAAKAAHPQMQEIMRPLFKKLWVILPEVFGDINP